MAIRSKPHLSTRKLFVLTLGVSFVLALHVNTSRSLRRVERVARSQLDPLHLPLASSAEESDYRAYYVAPGVIRLDATFGNGEFARGATHYYGVMFRLVFRLPVRGEVWMS